MKLSLRNPFATASRDKRELEAVKDLGYKITVFSDDDETPDEVLRQGYSFISASFQQYAGNKKNLVARALKIIRDVHRYCNEVAALNPDVISCHNIYSLLVGYCVRLRLKKNPILIYDAHEYELGRKPYVGHPLLYRSVKFLEGYLLKRTNLSIVINKGIGEAMTKAHGFEFNYIVVRSVPVSFPNDEEVTKRTRREILSKFEEQGCPPNSGNFVAMYQGYIQEYRGIENLLQATADLPWLKTVILGDANPRAKEYLSSVRRMVDNLGITKRVLFLPAVSHNELWRYTSSADVGIVGHQPVVENYVYALPNKFFENVQAMTPVICTDVPELSRLVTQFDIGLLVPPGEGGRQWALAIQEMRDNRQMYSRFKTNLIRAKRELCWEEESKTLKEAILSVVERAEK